MISKKIQKSYVCNFVFVFFSQNIEVSDETIHKAFSIYKTL